MKFELGDFAFDHKFFLSADSTLILGNKFLVYYGIVTPKAECWLEYLGTIYRCPTDMAHRKTALVFVAHHVLVPTEHHKAMVDIVETLYR